MKVRKWRDSKFFKVVVVDQVWLECYSRRFVIDWNAEENWMVSDWRKIVMESISGRKVNEISKLWKDWSFDVLDLQCKLFRIKFLSGVMTLTTMYFCWFLYFFIIYNWLISINITEWVIIKSLTLETELSFEVYKSFWIMSVPSESWNI